jgi:hypothetical protein
VLEKVMKGIDNKDIFRIAAPVLATLLSLAWALVMKPYTAYGDTWALIPILAAMCFIIAWHIFLSISPCILNRATAILYGLIHMVFSLYIAVLSLMWLSKDSLRMLHLTRPGSRTQ